MKSEIKPGVAVAVIVVIAAVVFGLVFMKSSSVSRENTPPPGMPPEVASEIQRRGMGATGPASNNGRVGGGLTPQTGAPAPFAPPGSVGGTR